MNQIWDKLLPKRALNAGSTLPPLARRTAFIIATSIEGKASLSIFSACCPGVKGRGGFGGATSSLFVDERAGGELPCKGSSSKSSSFAVVGDSGWPLGFCSLSANRP